MHLNSHESLWHKVSDRLITSIRMLNAGKTDAFRGSLTSRNEQTKNLYIFVPFPINQSLILYEKDIFAAFRSPFRTIHAVAKHFTTNDLQYQKCKRNG